MSNIENKQQEPKTKYDKRTPKSFKDFSEKLDEVLRDSEKGSVGDFGSMEFLLKEYTGSELVEGERNRLKSYFEVQKSLKKGKRTEAKQRSLGLNNKYNDWNSFEERYIDLLAFIDVAVRGSTNQYGYIVHRTIKKPKEV
ncbi:MAG: hypothetical protein PVJ52_01720 [Candidatus Woesebacteria bacterium]|jgi:hypothetical protein